MFSCHIPCFWFLQTVFIGYEIWWQRKLRKSQRKSRKGDWMWYGDVMRRYVYGVSRRYDGCRPQSVYSTCSVVVMQADPWWKEGDSNGSTREKKEEMKPYEKMVGQCEGWYHIKVGQIRRGKRRIICSLDVYPASLGFFDNIMSIEHATWRHFVQKIAFFQHL